MCTADPIYFPADTPKAKQVNSGAKQILMPTWKGGMDSLHSAFLRSSLLTLLELKYPQQQIPKSKILNPTHTRRGPATSDLRKLPFLLSAANGEAPALAGALCNAAMQHAAGAFRKQTRKLPSQRFKTTEFKSRNPARPLPRLFPSPQSQLGSEPSFLPPGWALA